MSEFSIGDNKCSKISKINMQSTDLQFEGI